MSAGGRGHKYKAKRTVCPEGHSHPSAAEARRCAELHLLQRAGEITHLEIQPRFPVHIEGKLVFTYSADFSYFPQKPMPQGRVIEDVKGFLTPVYKLKKKIVEAYYRGVKIVEVR